MNDRSRPERSIEPRPALAKPGRPECPLDLADHPGPIGAFTFYLVDMCRGAVAGHCSPCSSPGDRRNGRRTHAGAAPAARSPRGGTAGRIRSNGTGRGSMAPGRNRGRERQAGREGDLSRRFAARRWSTRRRPGRSPRSPRRRDERMSGAERAGRGTPRSTHPFQLQFGSTRIARSRPRCSSVSRPSRYRSSMSFRHSSTTCSLPG